jgi:hypothetical protein
VDFLNKDDEEGRIQAISAISSAFSKETDLQTALRMATTIANLGFGNEEAFAMIKMLDTKRPNINDLKAVEGEKDVEKSKQMIKEICDFLDV